MTTMTLFRMREASPKLEPGAAIPAAVSIRALLRDTGLLVSTLSAGGLTENFEVFRQRCKQLIEQFDEALRQQGYPKDVREDAIVAQCALLDETALRHLDDEKKAQWMIEPLQVEQLKYHNSGEYVFERLDTRMRETPANVDLLECYAAILGLGFLGRYALEDKSRRDNLIARLSAQIAQLRPERRSEMLTDHDGRRFVDWIRRLSPWAIATLGFVIALAVWLVWHMALDAQLASIAPKVIKP